MMTDTFRDIEKLEAVRTMIRSSATQKGHRLSRLGLLPDHFHLTLGTPLESSPEDVALSYMNNIAFVYDMRPVLMSSFYVGTFGEYDLGAIPRVDQVDVKKK